MTVTSAPVSTLKVTGLSQMSTMTFHRCSSNDATEPRSAASDVVTSPRAPELLQTRRQALRKILRANKTLLDAEALRASFILLFAGFHAKQCRLQVMIVAAAPYICYDFFSFTKQS
ncbi:uncharacterized protein LOC120839676 [Ixodes scapularis]|uniref:uncharacterized protein LOC120839676 n=1 Tax=Ixodes scapularis TaxID=6945 RepID=UPI001A9EDD5B|nr:uncharacterized protein LOC120839676 [Ixodes scapularis]